MPSATLQFHATPKEVIEMAQDLATETGQQVAKQIFFPRFLVVGASHPLFTGTDRGALVLRYDRIETDVDSQFEFSERNPDSLFFSLPYYDKKVLREAAVGGVSSDLQVVKRWRNMLRTLRDQMRVGAVMSNSDTGVSSQAPRHRYTSGAQQLSEAGVEMLSIAGGTSFTFTST